MKKSIVILLFLTNCLLSHSQRYDLIITNDNDSILCTITAMNDSTVSLWMRMNGKWDLTSILIHDIKEIKKNYIKDIKKDEFSVKDSTSRILNKNTPIDKFGLYGTGAIGIGKNGISWYNGLTLRLKNNLVTIRYIYEEKDHDILTVSDIGILYGINFGKYSSLATVSLGISYEDFVEKVGSETIYYPGGMWTAPHYRTFYLYEQYTAFGIPVEIRFLKLMNKNLAFGINVFSNLNLRKSSVGLSLSIQFLKI